MKRERIRTITSTHFEEEWVFEESLEGLDGEVEEVQTHSAGSTACL